MKTSLVEFPEPRSWEEFLNRWQDARWLREHIGLLHELYYMDATKFTPNIVNFYIHVSGSKNIDLKYGALRKLIDFIGHQKIDLYNFELLDTNRTILNFLSERKQGALFKPLPFLVLKYLEDFQRVLTHEQFVQISGRYRYDHEKVSAQYAQVHEAYQDLMPLFVKAMLDWGWAEYIDTDWRRDEVIQWIDEYLASHEFAASECFGFIRSVAKISKDPGGWDIHALYGNAQSVINASAYFQMQKLVALNAEEVAMATCT